jgi:hypothetical protein
MTRIPLFLRAFGTSTALTAADAIVNASSCREEKQAQKGCVGTEMLFYGE